MTSLKTNSTGRSRRWSDIASSEDELEEDSTTLPPLQAIDDSYREAPLDAVEDSRLGLKGKLNSAAHLGPEPKDFAFLFSEVDSSRLRGKTDDENSNVEDSLRTGQWRPNAQAPEFIPTLTMTCPLVPHPAVPCFLQGVATPCRSPLTSHAPSDHGAQDDEVVGFGDVQTPNRKPIDRQRKEASSTRKRRPSSFQVPIEKRAKSEERQVASTTSATPTSTRISQEAQGQQMPEASEEEWQRRIHTRTNSIELEKQSKEYQWYHKLKPRDAREDADPMTPDANDRKLSKRRFKHDVQRWRSAIVERYLQAGHPSGGGNAGIENLLE